MFTIDGKRKYLTRDEQDRFMVAAKQLDRAAVRTFCLTMAYTECRISEALVITVPAWQHVRREHSRCYRRTYLDIVRLLDFCEGKRLVFLR